MSGILSRPPYAIGMLAPSQSLHAQEISGRNPWSSAYQRSGGLLPLLKTANVHIQLWYKVLASTLSPSSPSLSKSSIQTFAIREKVESNSLIPSIRPPKSISTLRRFGHSKRLRSAGAGSYWWCKSGSILILRRLTWSLGAESPLIPSRFVEGLYWRKAWSPMSQT